MARHQVVKTLCVVVMLAHLTLAATIDETRTSGTGRTSAGPSTKTSTTTTTATASRQARAGGHRRDYRCLNCPNTDERARQAPLAYANRDDRPVADRNSWYYPSDYTDHIDRRYPYYVSGDTPTDYAAGRYDDRYASARFDGRYDDRYYGPAKASGYLPAAAPPAADAGRYQYGDYRGNGYDNRDAQYTMRAGVDAYYREPDYDRYTYHRTALAAPEFGRDYGREYPRDYVPPRSYPRDYVRDYAPPAPARDYGGRYGAAPPSPGAAGDVYAYRGGDYYDRDVAAGGYTGGNRLGYDNRNFRPWDESYRGTSGFDNSGRGYYFASRLPYGGGASSPVNSPPPPSQYDTKPYRTHYYLPNSPSSASSSSSSSSPASASPSLSSSSSASSSSSPTSSDPHKPVANGGGGGSSSSGGVSSYDNGAGIKSGYGGVGVGGRYADRDRPDKEAQSTRYGSGSTAARYLRPLAGSYLFERVDGGGVVEAVTGNQPPRAERLTMQPATPEATPSSTSAASSEAAASAASTSSSSADATLTSTTTTTRDVTASAVTSGTVQAADVTASEVASLVAAAPTTTTTVAVDGGLDGASTQVADERL